jgi:uncharacterized protein YutE (UPF0331/DUF86 family)
LGERARRKENSIISLISRMGWSDPIGKRVIHSWGNNKAYWSVVGVVKDFHFLSLRSAIRPMYFFLDTSMNRFVSIKLGGGDLTATMGFVEGTWKRLYPGLPFDYLFLDSVLDRLYRSEERQRQLFSVLSALAVFIACLGLFGLAAYAAEQRTREIGIRKVLGASTPGIARLLSGEFEAIFDVSRHILSKGFAFKSLDYKEVARKLGEKGIVDKAYAQVLIKMAGYRNRMVHFYKEIKPEELYDILQNHLEDLLWFLEEMRIFLEKVKS